jgi:tetratricopeptide (TPR) repeat protein
MKFRSSLALLVVAAVAAACYNDSDTNLTELRDNLDITYAIAGRFTIYPPEYYKRRIEIQTANLKKNPNDLNAYDNLAVAYDRLGKHDQAIATIRKERAMIESGKVNPLTEVKDEFVPDAPPVNHRYTVEANEGTFLIHRWISNGGNPKNLTDAVAAEKHIAKAIEINPNAHFGREFAQLYSMRAILKGAKEGDWKTHFTENLISIADQDKVDHKALRKGIAGMMVLGNAWNSPVMLEAVMRVVPTDTQVRLLCALRIQEIETRSAYPDSDLGYFHLAKLIVAKSKNRTWFKPVHIAKDIETLGEIRANAIQFSKSQTDFVLNRLKAGKHPDSDPDFWVGYKPLSPVSMDRYNLPDTTRHYRNPWLPYSYVTLSLAATLLVAIGVYKRRLRKSRLQ